MNTLINKRAVVMAFLLLFSPIINAGIIDTIPPGFTLSYFDFTGPDVAGGTFIADDTFLDSFTLSIGANNAGGTISAVLMSTVGGIPSALLWSSAITAIPGVATELVFNPDFILTPGTEYFIGADSGQLTGASGSFNLGFVNNLIPGQHWENLNNGSWSSNTTYDISSRIVMTAGQVPLPSTLALFALGFAALGYRKRREA